MSSLLYLTNHWNGEYHGHCRTYEDDKKGLEEAKTAMREMIDIELKRSHPIYGGSMKMTTKDDLETCYEIVRLQVGAKDFELYSSQDYFNDSEDDEVSESE